MTNRSDNTAREMASAEPVALHARAMDNLAFIRDTMTRASRFTSVSGRATVAVGIMALAGSAIASLRLTPYWWLSCWLLLAAAASTAGFTGAVLKARRACEPLLEGAGRRFFGNFLPAAIAGAMLSLTCVLLGHEELLPGVWMTLYGLAVFSGGAHSVPPVPILGGLFMACGGAALLMPVLFGPEPAAVAMDVLLAMGFGGLHILFGMIIARRYGG